jgi:hypothetical protein
VLKWTAEQITAMAPDSSAASAGQGLAAKKHWGMLGSDARALWGECQGSGAKPYQVQIDLSEPAFKCSCPSRKFPCKHSLGLFLLWVEQGQSLPLGETPAWVTEWLGKRDEKAETKEKKVRESDPESEARSQAAQEKRSAGREAKVAAGIEELDRWLRDLVRGGLAAAQTRPARFWLDMAARMVDSQAPGIARQIREMAVIPASGEGWAGRLLERIGRLWLLIEGYRRLEQQPELAQATIRTSVGWTSKQEEVAQLDGVRAEWLVVGRRVSEEDKLLVQRTWLLSREGSALLLHFAMKGQAFDISFMPGSCLDAELVYFPGVFRQRVVLKSLFGESPTLKAIPCYGDAGSYLERYASDLAADPWIENHLMALSGVTPLFANGRAELRDAGGLSLPLNKGFQKSWHLVSLGGGRPITLFGEWDGHSVNPLCVMADGRFVDLSPIRGTCQ